MRKLIGLVAALGLLLVSAVPALAVTPPYYKCAYAAISLVNGRIVTSAGQFTSPVDRTGVMSGPPPIIIESTSCEFIKPVQP